MGTHLVDDGQKVEAGALNPVAKRAAVQIDPLPLEDLGLPIKRQVVTELRDDNPSDEQLCGQTAEHDMFGRVRLRHSLRKTTACIFRPPPDQNSELCGDHVQSLGVVFADFGYLAATTRAKRAGWLDHPLDPGQMGRDCLCVSAYASRKSASGPCRDCAQ